MATACAPHPTVMIAPPSHPLVGKRYLGLRALTKERFLVREPLTEGEVSPLTLLTDWTSLLEHR